MSLTPLSSNISPLSSNLLDLISSEPIAVDNELGSFSDIFTEAFNTAEVTDTADKASAVELLTGQADDFSGLLLDAQKAEISLNLALQIRNKAIDAYNEIMRIQI